MRFLFCGFFLLICHQSLKAQLGKHNILKGTLNTQVSSSKSGFINSTNTDVFSKSKFIAISFSPGYGMIYNSGLAFTYGFVFRTGLQKTIDPFGATQKTTGFAIGPAASLQKLYLIKNNIFYSPSVEANVVFGNSKTIETSSSDVGKATSFNPSVRFVPLSFTFSISKSILLNSSLGDIQMDYNRVKSTKTSVPNYGLTETFDIRLNANSLINVGCIFLLN
jgi:hypothetical protein